MVLPVMVLLIVSNGGSVADVIGGDDRSDGIVKNCCHDNKIASWLDRLFFLVLLALAARLFKCRRLFGFLVHRFKSC